MGFTLLEVDTATDFGEVIECQWNSYEKPYQSFFRMFCPLRGDGPSARTDSLKESVALQLEWHKSDPTSYWGKVVDDNGKIVGACLWKICPTNPFQDYDGHSEAYWHPEGERREYVSRCLDQFDAPRRKMGARPQVYLNILYTHPDYRRQGVADLIMNWGKQKADEMGVEMWLDATEYGVPVYKKHGFTVVGVNRLRPTKTAPGKAWREIEEELQPMIFYQMWRPSGGNYEEGKTVKPWE
ncbi:GNAT family acetyltransferase [Fusarium albosuccineum]|uniref:GNAT family acetyltransferase n=1 Tax=Fusarium albosuccineum TaxID=1237068 RepID=A0A8H4L7D1_9HYPO|nr:GNAT family acetyltransferase [Fusarium albosuccineum]